MIRCFLNSCLGFITEITSNVATANILLPVLGRCTVQNCILLLCSVHNKIVTWKRKDLVLSFFSYIEIVAISMNLVHFLSFNPIITVLRSALAELARSTGTNPLYLMVPATVTCRHSGQISPQKRYWRKM